MTLSPAGHQSYMCCSLHASETITGLLDFHAVVRKICQAHLCLLRCKAGCAFVVNEPVKLAPEAAGLSCLVSVLSEASNSTAPPVNSHLCLGQQPTHSHACLLGLLCTQQQAVRVEK